MAIDRARHDINLKPSLIAVSNADGETPVSIWADPTTHALVTSGGGGGTVTQYTDQGAVVTHPTGNAIIWFDSSNTPNFSGTNQPFPVSATQTGTWLVGTKTASVNVGQKTVATTATQISVTSTVPTNGILIGALSTNTASIFVGGSGVTTSTGVELTAGSSMAFTCNLNTLYIISVASTTDKIWYNVT